MPEGQSNPHEKSLQSGTSTTQQLAGAVKEHEHIAIHHPDDNELSQEPALSEGRSPRKDPGELSDIEEAMEARLDTSGPNLNIGSEYIGYYFAPKEVELPIEPQYY